MADIVTPSKRSQMMAGIGGKNTKPEILVRKELHRRGFRFRLHTRDLPGRPDIVLAKFKAVIFVHGCFWHGHNCHLFKWPKQNEAFWLEKISANKRRDDLNRQKLRQAGWRVAEVWECSLRGKERLCPTVIGDRLSKWLITDEPVLNLEGPSSIALS